MTILDCFDLRSFCCHQPSSPKRTDQVGSSWTKLELWKKLNLDFTQQTWVVVGNCWQKLELGLSRHNTLSPEGWESLTSAFFLLQLTSPAVARGNWSLHTAQPTQQIHKYNTNTIQIQFVARGNWSLHTAQPTQHTRWQLFNLKESLQ